MRQFEDGEHIDPLREAYKLLRDPAVFSPHEIQTLALLSIAHDLRVIQEGMRPRVIDASALMDDALRQMGVEDDES